MIHLDVEAPKPFRCQAELAGEEDNDSTLDWIDKQIRNIEGRREACESRRGLARDVCHPLSSWM